MLQRDVCPNIPATVKREPKGEEDKLSPSRLFDCQVSAVPVELGFPNSI